MKVRVIRGKGDNEYPGVLVNELCTEEIVGVEFGKDFLYKEGFDKLWYDADTGFKGAIKCSDIVDVSDASIGESFRARITSWSLSVGFSESGGLEVDQTMTLERSKLDE